MVFFSEPTGRMEFTDRVPASPPILPEREWNDRERLVSRMLRESILKDPEGKRALTKALTEYGSEQGFKPRFDADFMSVETFSKFMHEYTRSNLSTAHGMELASAQMDIQTWKAFAYSECLAVVLKAMNEPIAGQEQPGITLADDGQYYPTPHQEGWRNDVASQFLAQIRVNAPELLKAMDSKKGKISKQAAWRQVSEAYRKKPTDLVQPRVWRKFFSQDFASSELQPIFEKWLERKT